MEDEGYAGFYNRFPVFMFFYINLQNIFIITCGFLAYTLSVSDPEQLCPTKVYSFFIRITIVPCLFHFVYLLLITYFVVTTKVVNLDDDEDEKSKPFLA